MAFIALSPFVVLSTADAQGRQDASPRGGAPGFVRVDGRAARCSSPTRRATTGSIR